jgi:pantothenate kinase
MVVVPCLTTLDDAVAALSKRVDDLLIKFSHEPHRRIMIALAGVPGSGKSTVSRAVLENLSLRGVANVLVVPMVRRTRIEHQQNSPGSDA